MIVFSVLFGFFSGMALGVVSLAGLSGTPITGAMISAYGGYWAAIGFAGVAALVGARGFW
jgi:hypothetical protein